MADEDFKQRLTAIISADVKDYSRLLSQDRVNTIKTINEHREMFAGFVKQYGGRVVDMPGDNILAVLESVSDAVNCAVEIQRELAERNAEVPSTRMMQWRIGIELGDVVEKGGAIYGDGVNIAARIEGFAKAGGICISGRVYDQVHGKLGLQYEFLGQHDVKNIAKPVSVYRVLSYPGAAAHRVVKAKGDVARKWRIAAVASVAVIIVAIGAVLAWLYLFRTGIPPTEVAKPKKVVSPVEKAESSIPDIPSIAVLPFDNLSGDPEREYFVDGMTEEVISKLSMNQSFSIISRISTFTYKGKSITAHQAGKELGAHYILEGSVKKAGDRIRITAQLIDAETDSHLWAQTYDRKYDIESIFDIHDNIAQQIAAALGVEHEKLKKERARNLSTDDLSGFDFFWRGLYHLRKFTAESNSKAREYSQKAIELLPKSDQRLSSAYSLLGWTYYLDYALGWDTRKVMLENAVDLAQKAIAINEGNSPAHMLLANIYSVTGEYGKAIAKAKRALELSPNSPDMHVDMGVILNSAGKYVAAIAALEKAIQLNPNPFANYYTALGLAYKNLGRYDDSIEMLNKAVARDPNYQFTYYVLTWCYLEFWNIQQNEDPEILDQAYEIAKKCVDLNENDPVAHMTMGVTYQLRGQYNMAISELEKTIAIAPEMAYGYAWLANVLISVGKLENAIEYAEKATELPPKIAAALQILGSAYRLTGMYEEAEAVLKRALTLNLSFAERYYTHIDLSILYSELGRMEEARAEATEVLKMSPNFSVEVWGERAPYQNQEQRKRVMAALRKAGLK